MKTSVKIHKNITTTLPNALLQELAEAARELQVQKNDILADAFILWNKKRKQELVAESYGAMSGDRQLHELADEGLAESEKNITLCE
ncbi:MAG: hypothetical protein AAB421_02850 [Patescibacteria group bacterium]